MAHYTEEYQVLRNIGVGANARIEKVRHRKWGYIRAIKILSATIQGGEDDKAYKTFVEECGLLLKIGNGGNNHIVRIYQPRLFDQEAVVEMDYIEGCTLTEYIAKEKLLPLPEVLRFISEIGGALVYRFLMDRKADGLRPDPEDGSKVLIDESKEKELIHKYGIIHNDLHSSNIMRRSYDGSYVLLDFGISIQGDVAVKKSSRGDGDPEYKAPEKWDDESLITSQSDIYSFGVLMYEALAGSVPFVYSREKFSSDMAANSFIYEQHKEARPDPIYARRAKVWEELHPGVPYEKDYPDWLEEMIMKCLSKDPDDRYVNAKEFMKDFEAHMKEVRPASAPTAGDEAFRAERASLREEIERLKTALEELRERTEMAESNYAHAKEFIKKNN